MKTNTLPERSQRLLPLEGAIAEPNLLLGSELANYALPYQTVFSLKPLIAQVAAAVQSDHAGEAFLAREITSRIAAAPDLLQPLQSAALLTTHKDLVELLFLFLFSPAQRQQQLFNISQPFHNEAVYTSPAMQQFMLLDNVRYTFNQLAEDLQSVNLMRAWLTILRQCYGRKVDLSPATLLQIRDPENGLSRFFKPLDMEDYIEVKVIGDLPPLREQDFQKLLRNIHHSDLWLALLPPDKFSFHGFSLSQFTEVTEVESLSQMKHKLLRRDAVLDVEKLRELADLLRIYFQRPDVQLGFSAIDYPLEYRVDHQYKIRFNLLADHIERLTDSQHATSVYHQAFTSKEVLLVEDLRTLTQPAAPEQQLMAMGFHSLLIAPLLNKEERVIGLLELASPEAYGLNSFVELKFREIVSLFRTALARSREEVDNQLEAILREQYTSLHPSVEWRFIEAAYHILEQRSAGQEASPELIQFDQVYPLYGQADIVGSTRLRNEAVYGDLMENMKSAYAILQQAVEMVPFPLLHQRMLEIQQALSMSLDDFNNSDETRLVEFLVREVLPLLEQLATDQPRLRQRIKKAFPSHNSQPFQLISSRREAYEQSLGVLNMRLSKFFEERNRLAQDVLPHYFEKYKTDGIEYEIFAGQSLLRKQFFSEIHLSNLRLSQLIDLCDATRLVEQVGKETPILLQTAQLAFAYTTPVNIRFRMDEKRFDVDGSYDVRYEILKKRIDKATIHEGRERLTQAGTVSIVYLHDRDRREYLGYLDYLRQQGYIRGEIEEFILDSLQSVQGLRALRFTVL